MLDSTIKINWTFKITWWDRVRCKLGFHRWCYYVFTYKSLDKGSQLVSNQGPYIACMICKKRYRGR